MAQRRILCAHWTMTLTTDELAERLFGSLLGYVDVMSVYPRRPARLVPLAGR